MDLEHAATDRVLSRRAAEFRHLRATARAGVVIEADEYDRRRRQGSKFVHTARTAASKLEFDHHDIFDDGRDRAQFHHWSDRTASEGSS